MRFNWLFPSLLGVVGSLVLALPAEAASLRFWQFNAAQNRLVFTTDEAVQPRAQLIANPTRLVIDLPGTTLSRPGVTQRGSGGIREIRVGQFDDQTARIVVELEPGYTLDPQQIQVRGTTPTEWAVQLPTPQRDESSPLPIARPTPPPETAPAPQPEAVPPILDAATQLDYVRVTPDGFFIRTSGTPPEIDADRSRDRRRFSIELENTAVSPQLIPLEQPIGRNGVDRLVIEQVETSPPVARITLELSSAESDWRATVSNLGGIVVVPTGGTIANPVEVEEPTAAAEPQQPATIQAVELSAAGGQLVIRGDQPLTYTSGWDQSSASYRVLIPNARLAEGISPPRLESDSPLLRVRLLQQDDSVAVLVQPARGVQIGDVNQPSTQVLALALRRSEQAIAPLPAPGRTPTPLPSTPPPPTELPRIPNSRIVIVVDPGHGGVDPGAVGINNIYEKDIVLSVSLQVAEILQQQGVQVVMTRTTDRTLDLQPRVDIAERANADLFVSIHANAISMSRPDVNGVEVYYYGTGEQLARSIHSSILQSISMNDRGVRRARFYVLRNTSMPAVLVETGFVTGRDDAPRLADANFRSQMAAAIARGILQYVQRGL